MNQIRIPVIVGGQVIAPDDVNKAVPETVGGSAAEQIAIREMFNKEPIAIRPTDAEYYSEEAIEARARKIKADALEERARVQRRSI